MNLKEVFGKWNTYTPKIFGNDKLDDPFTVQYKLVAKGEAKRIEALADEELEQEVEQWPSIGQHLGEEWEKFAPRVKQDMLLFAAHVGRVDNLTDDGEQLTDIMQVFAVLNGVLGGQLMRELMGCIIGVNLEDKKNSAL